MASPSSDLDIEAQTNSVTDTQSAIIPPPTINTANHRLPNSADTQPQATNTNKHHNGRNPVQQTAHNSQFLRDESYTDSSDGLWSVYLNVSEKVGKEVIEKWKGDADGILVFTGLFSATVAAFITESYKKLSPHPGDTTNVLLTQISQQFADISNGTPLTSVAAQSDQPFKPPASAVRVNVLWFLSLVLSLNCALSATLMQQWARRYQELTQRRDATHRRGRVQAYIFDGMIRFQILAQVVVPISTLLHIAVFLFFAGLVEFLFPINTTVAYTTLVCVGMSALLYTILTILPSFYFNCMYGTPLSGFIWRISRAAFLEIFKFVRHIEAQFRFHGSLSIIWSRTGQPMAEKLDSHITKYSKWISEGHLKSVEFSAYGADSAVVTRALEWTLTALDEEKEIEDFAAGVPGFFESRIPNATLAVLPLMSHQPNTDPIFGSRLCVLLGTCIPGASLMDEKKRRHRLRVCLNCLWYFGRAYNHPEVSQPLPSYFHNTLIPEINNRVHAEVDSTLRVMGRCVVAVTINKLAADLESRTGPVTNGELEFLSAILGTEPRDVEILLNQPGAVALVNMISFTFGEVGSLAVDAVPPDENHEPDMVHQTLTIVSQALPAQEGPELQVEETIAIFNGSDGTFERILVSRLLDLLKTCVLVPSPLSTEGRTSRLRMCLKGLWYFGQAYNNLGNLVPLPSYIYVTLSTSEMTRCIRERHDLGVRVVGRCVEALVVNKLAAELQTRDASDPASDDELACLSAILGTKSDDVILLLSHSGAIEFANIVFLAWVSRFPASARVPSDVPDVVQQTFGILSRALPVELKRTDTLMSVSDGASSPTAETYESGLRMWMKNLWRLTRESNEGGNSVPLPSYVFAFTIPEMARRIREEPDLVVRVVGCCVGALVVNKLATDINSVACNDPVKDSELACLSAILGTKSDDVMLLLRHPGAIEFTNIVFLAWAISRFSASARVPSDVQKMVRQTFGILSQALPAELKLLDRTDTLMNVSDGTSPLTTDMFKTVLRVCLKSLWTVVRASDEPGNSAPLPSYVYGAFANPEMTRRIHQDTDLTTGVIGRCVETLVVNKLAADINSRRDAQRPVNDDELACLSTILRTKSDDLMLLLRHPGAIELTNMVFLASHDIHSFTPQTVPSYMLVVVKQTSSSLFRALPPDFSIRMQTETLINVSDGSSPLTAETYRSALRVWMKNLWDFTREYIDRGNSGPLPSYVYGAFSNPEMTRRIHKDTDLITGVIGRCIGALVVNRLVADNAQVPVNDDELACLSAILGTKSHDVERLLRNPGAIEFTNMVFLTLHDLYSFSLQTVPSYMLDVVQQTSSVLCQALPHELNVKMQTETQMNVSDGTPLSVADLYMYRDVLLVLMKNLWDFTREFNERGNSVSLPLYVCISFTNPEITRRIFVQRNLNVRLIGRCLEALVVNKLAADINSRNGPEVRNDELACLSAILGTKSDDVELCLSRPGAIQLVNLASLALGDVSSLRADRMMPDTGPVLQRTLALLSQALVPPGNAQLPLDHMVAPLNLPEDRFERTIVTRLHALLKTSLPGASSLAEDARTSSLRTCLKTLWNCGRAYHQTPDPLPSYFPLVLARPEITSNLRNEQDPVSRITGHCFGALIVSKLVDHPIPLSDRTRNAELACILAILGVERRQALLLPFQIRLINLRNVVSLMSGEIDTLTTAGTAVDVLNIAEGTLYDLAGLLRAIGFLRVRLSEDQEKLLQEIHSNVMNALDSDQFKKEPAKTLGRLRQILEKPLPGVE